MNFKQTVYDLARFCPSCQRSFGRFEYLCPNCEARLLAQAKVHCIYHEGIPLKFLYLAEDSKPQMKSLLYQQKGGAIPKTIRALVPAFFTDGWSRSDTIFVPAPGRHAELLAQALASVASCFVFNSLRKTSAYAQKNLDKKARGQSRMGSSHRLENVVLVDDIVVSGHTALACYTALGRPKAFQVWSLFYRPLGQQKGVDLREGSYKKGFYCDAAKELLT